MNNVETFPTATDVAVMPVWSLKADAGMADLVEAVAEPEGAGADELVDEHAASAATSTIPLIVRAIRDVRRVVEVTSPELRVMIFPHLVGQQPGDAGRTPR
ncbi:MAG TPA: hypothetical protein VMV06_06530 [Acidimicrobiales bacterium]|nr:hypothetical protein [Acidimicrobiales bacterium]